jgi:hypothetical protein
MEKQIESTLGADVLATYKEYENTYIARDLITKVSSELLFSGAPLAPREARALLDIISTTSRSKSGRVQVNSLALDAIFAQSATFLSPDQQAAVQSVITGIARRDDYNERFLSEINKRMQPISLKDGRPN